MEEAEKVKKIDIQEYKKNSLKSRIMHVKLPSGLEFDLKLPSPAQMIFGLKGVNLDDDIESTEAMLRLVKFPGGLTYDDFTPEDLVALIDQVSDFFGKAAKSLLGFKSMQK